MKPDSFVSDMLRNTGSQPERLLQYLYEIQHRFFCIPDDAIQRLSDVLKFSPTHIHSVIDFYAFLNTSPPIHFDIRFSDNITDQMLGNHVLMNSLCDQLGAMPGIARQDGRLIIQTTSCTGMCDQGPAMLINGRAITRLTPKRIGEIGKLVETDQPLDSWPEDFFSLEDAIHRRDLLLSETPAEDATLRALLSQGKDQLLQQLQFSGLRGQGGAGFSTALKWKLCQKTEATSRYVVCNADEGEPGTFKDRVLLKHYADRLIEGMTLCAGVINASQGFIYLRAEYACLRKGLETALQTRRDKGLLGSHIMGEVDFEFDIEIRMGAGAYICGEESALIESLEGKRGIPRIRPPFPVSRGYLGYPTVVNNVETFVAASLIAIHGAEWFTRVGTHQSPGTKLLSISGDCAQPGIYEYPYGVTIEQVLEECGAQDAQAVQIAGAAGHTLPPAEFSRRIAFEDIATGGSFMVFNQQRSMLDVAGNFTRFFNHESCGFCTPCRVGSRLMLDLLYKVETGHGTAYDLNEMKNIAALMRATSHCGLGMTAANPILDTLEKFPRVYLEKMNGTEYEPAFDLDAALQEARDITSRDDDLAHLGFKA